MTLGSALPAGLRQQIQQLAGDRPVWLVGGAVRDALLSRPSQDLDFVVAGEARPLARAVAQQLGGHYFDLDAERDTGRVVRPAAVPQFRTLDFARLRGDEILSDLAGRDFTVNALAYRLQSPQALVDVGSGLQDLKDRRLRACSPSAMSDDPVRCLRGVRLALELQLSMEPSTREQIRAAGLQLPASAAERVRDELLLMLHPGQAGRAARLLKQLGLLGPICPELEVAPNDRWQQTLATLDRLGPLLQVLLGGPPAEEAGNLILAQASLHLGRFRLQLQQAMLGSLPGGRQVEQVLCLAGLCLAADTPALAGRRCRALRLSAAECRMVEDLLTGAQTLAGRPDDGGPTPLQAHRFYREYGEAGVGAIVLDLARALATSSGPFDEAWVQRLQAARVLLEARFERYAELIQPSPWLRGDELIELLGIQAGPWVGEILRDLAEAQVQGIVTSRAEALEHARRQLADGADATGRG